MFLPLYLITKNKTLAVLPASTLVTQQSIHTAARVIPCSNINSFFAQTPPMFPPLKAKVLTNGLRALCDLSTCPLPNYLSGLIVNLSLTYSTAAALASLSFPIYAKPAHLRVFELTVPSARNTLLSTQNSLNLFPHFL